MPPWRSVNEGIEDGDIDNEEVTSDEIETPIVEVNKEDASDIKIELLNGSGSKDVLSKVKKDLTERGYKVINSTSTTTTAKTTIINKTDVDSTFTENIKDVIGVGNVSTSSVSSSNVDITIIIGKDYDK